MRAPSIQYCDFDSLVAQALERLHAEGRYRRFATLERKRHDLPRAKNYGLQFAQQIQSFSEVSQHLGTAADEMPLPDATITPSETIVWCSNDYLCMSVHPDVIAAAHAAIETVGVGAGGTRNIAGTSIYHVELEKELAALHGTEAALLFNSGYMANFATLAALSNLFEGLHIISDSENHSSMIEGIKNARCAKIIWDHSDAEKLEKILSSLPASVPKLVALESVYSMDGDIAPLKEICQIARKYGAWIYLDEVHAVGMYGSQGEGVAGQVGVSSEVQIIQGTLGKAFGAMGGYIAGRADLLDAIRSYASGFIFTTSLAPAIAAAATVAVRTLRQDRSGRELQLERVSQLRGALRRHRIPFLHQEGGHIVPVMVGDPGATQRASDRLLACGHYVQPINYPTVPRGTERLRFTPGPRHTLEMINEVSQVLDSIWDELDLKRPD